MALRIQKRPFNEIYDIRLQTHTSTFYCPFVFSNTDFFPTSHHHHCTWMSECDLKLKLPIWLWHFYHFTEFLCEGWFWNKKYILKCTWFNWQKGIFISIFISQFFFTPVIMDYALLNEYFFILRQNSKHLTGVNVLGIKSQKNTY